MQKLSIGLQPGGFSSKAPIQLRVPSIQRRTVIAMTSLRSLSSASSSKVRAALNGIQAVRDSMQANSALVPLAAPSGAAAALCHPWLPAMVTATNEALELWKAQTGGDSWLGLPWLMIECYMYTAVATAVQSQPLLAGGTTGSSYGSHLSSLDVGTYDPFLVQKQSAWAKSSSAVAELATAIEAIHADLQRGGPLREAMSNPERQGAVQQKLFEVVQYCLWGNKTDLSLRQDAALDAAASLAETERSMVRGEGHEGSGSSSAGPATTNPLIVNEYIGLWEHLKGVARAKGGHGGRVDIIMDNSGLELYGDFVLADFLVETGLASQVVFHGKCLPWFVSDATITDFTQTLTSCQQPYSPASPGSPQSTQGQQPSEAWGAVTRLGKRWGEHLATGRWRYTDHPFWTTPAPFCWMEAMAPELYSNLSSSSCLVTKGDLNYRKLLSDCSWPAHTRWGDSFLGWLPAPLLSLRTCKADLATGLAEGQAKALNMVDPEWQVNGKFGMIQFTKE
ncbi:hypothetical protein DUNSADRAFT_14060 [Dunaliella salina]|uniref:Sugar phosphate phosphatase n=1 Tax=Dunaliella salina TaxID=3046 RepID=A0ABQ7G846_DUNSA|nr:hypothetical protein DUNSADRAFT_14060 [Dunaliella salina]|eukprot:KAF5830777.1 hypothetical protein DUNSADRAFT_14060 [Dunaliella salina]